MYNLKCPTGEVPCLWANTCMCAKTEQALQYYGQYLETRGYAGDIARYHVLGYLMPYRFPLPDWLSLSYKYQHRLLVCKMQDTLRQDSNHLQNYHID